MPIWVGTSKENKDKIFKVQNRAIRIICGANFYDSFYPLFLKSQILTVHGLYVLELAKFYLNNKTKITDLQNIHPHNTRFSSLIQHGVHRTTLYERTPQYMCGRIVNVLNTKYNIKIETKNDLKIVKEMLLDSPLYLLDDHVSQL